MKRSIIIACALALGSSLGFADHHESKPGQSPATSSTSQYEPEHMQLFDSSLVENKKLMDQDGKNIGKLERLLIDSQSGRVRFAVVQVDKEWSLNDPEVIIPWRTLQISRVGEKDYAIKMDTTREKLMGAPRFDKALVGQLNTREAGQPIYTYWGVEWQEDARTTSGTALSPSTLPATGTTSGTGATSTTPSASSTTSSTTSTTPDPTDTTGSSPSFDPNRKAPTTSTDGSTGQQPLGNQGTTDSPKPDPTKGQPAPSDSLNQPGTSQPGPSETLDLGDDNPSTKPDRESDSSQPDRTLGGDQSD